MTRSIFILLGIFGVFLVVVYFTLHRQVPNVPATSREGNYKLTMEYNIDITNGINGTISVDVINQGDNITNLTVYLKTSDFILVDPPNITTNISSGQTKTFFFTIEPGIENGVFMLKKGYLDDDITIIVKSEEGNVTLKGSRKISVCEDIHKTINCAPEPLKINVTSKIFEDYANIVVYLKNIFKQKTIKDISIKIDVPRSLAVNPRTTIIEKLEPTSTNQLGIIITPENQTILSPEHEPNEVITIDVTYMNKTKSIEVPIAVCQKINEEVVC